MGLKENREVFLDPKYLLSAMQQWQMSTFRAWLIWVESTVTPKLNYPLSCFQPGAPSDDLAYQYFSNGQLVEESVWVHIWVEKRNKAIFNSGRAGILNVKLKAAKGERWIEKKTPFPGNVIWPLGL